MTKTEQIKEEFEKFADCIKPIQFGQYDKNGVNIGFKSAKEMMIDFWLQKLEEQRREVQTQARNELMVNFEENRENWLKYIDKKVAEVKQSLVEEVEKLKEDLYSKPISDDLLSHNFRDGYVEALDTVLSIIKK